jgi:hypothetical protein
LGNTNAETILGTEPWRIHGDNVSGGSEYR